MNKGVQERRVRELFRIGNETHADRVRKCGAPDGILRFRRCKLRFCTRCAVQYEADNFAEAIGLLRRMRKPYAGVLMLRSRGDDLEGAFGMFRRALSLIRVRCPKLGITRMLGFIEPKRSKRTWSLHAHVAVQGNRYSSDALAYHWQKATDGRGEFNPDHREGLEDLVGYARYITKSESWCPAPDVLRLSDFATLIGAMRHERLSFAWGFPPPVWIIKASKTPGQ